ncbi:EF-hand domain-containing protein [Roseateles amylovorans]|uniref:EF-hand domain-containing protein n=1 Tax=Roseateles amylovorans TaxID=2978473 RepID=A0ABY6BAX4_9BURK|nr:EF-hand domain-containing protein [Roseateles amylovorans]UXH80735.1 EF-hand domain-containing protein [Roseateles amylovorans]
MTSVLTSLGVALVTALAMTAAAPAHAQDSKAAKAAQQLDARFAAADKDHDGKLTKAEAEAGMPRVAKRFDEIDTTKSGAVTLQQIKAYGAEHMKKK